MKLKTLSIALLAVIGMSLSSYAVDSPKANTGSGAKVLDHKMKDIDGKEVDLAKYKGKVVLMVNVASKCGLTPQYDQLVMLHKKYKKDGLVILGFPANNFGKQEPGTNAEIKTFCRTKYSVEFPMFSKVSVKGDNKSPLYKELTSKKTNGKFGGEIPWNFTKFLVNTDGEVIARFAPKVKPNSPEMVAKIEAELKKVTPKS